MQKLIVFYLLTISFSSFHFFALAKEVEMNFDFMFFDCKKENIVTEYCNVGKPKNWTKEEQTLFLEKINRDTFRESRWFFRVLKENQAVKLYRFHQLPVYNGNTYISHPAAAWVYEHDKAIVVGDNFFLYGDVSDPFAQIDRQQLILIHELAHVFDELQENLSSSVSFRKCFSKISSSLESPELLQKTIDEIKNLIVKSNPQKALELNRSFGRKYGVPSAYSMINPREAFAETIAYWLLDPTSEQYFQQCLVDWIQTKTRHRNIKSP